MKKISTEQLLLFAKQELARIYGENEYQDLFLMLSAKEKQSFSRVTPDAFGMEYLPAKLAMASLVWEHECRESGFSEEADTKVLFRQIMDGFRTPKMMPLATAFSDYYYACAPEGEEPPAVLMVKRLLGRLGLQQEHLHQDKGTIPFVFQTLLETLEGFRVSFENRCLELFLAGPESLP